MFVPVNCTSCGKPFQVPEAALGKPAACPWCQAVVTALPVAATVTTASQEPEASAATEAPNPPVHTGGSPHADSPVPQPGANAPGSPSEPLSLDDPPEPPRPKRPPAAVPVAPPTPAKRLQPATVLITAAIGFGLVVAVSVLTLLVLRYGPWGSNAAWSEFTPPDGSCSVQLPGSPKEEEVDPNPNGSVLGGKRYTASGWLSRTTAWVAWGDLDPALVKSLAADKDGVFAASALRAERDREKSRLEGSITNEVMVRYNASWGIEVHMDTPKGKVIERLLIVSDGPRPRLYVLGIRAKDLTPESPAARRLFNSFKVN
jgi:hypothetical protein